MASWLLFNIASGKGLSPVRRQASILTQLSWLPADTNFGGIKTKIKQIVIKQKL